jgi:hypothetical protein
MGLIGNMFGELISGTKKVGTDAGLALRSQLKEGNYLGMLKSAGDAAASGAKTAIPFSAIGGGIAGGIYGAATSEDIREGYVGDILSHAVGGAVLGGVGMKMLSGQHAKANARQGFEQALEKGKGYLSRGRGVFDSVSGDIRNIVKNAPEGTSKMEMAKDILGYTDKRFGSSRAYRAGKYLAQRPMLTIGGGLAAYGIGSMAMSRDTGGFSVGYNQQTATMSQSFGMAMPGPGVGVSTQPSGYMNTNFAQSTNGLVQGLHSSAHS